MRSLTALLALGLLVTALTVATPDAEAAGVCTYDDTYNNMGGPGSDCQGVACVGYSNGYWQTCVLRLAPCGFVCPVQP